MPLQLAVPCEVCNFLDEPLALVVARMGLAGKDELHGSTCVLGQLHDVVELIED